MKEQAYPFTAGFKVYTPAGMQVYFNVAGDEPAAHLQAVENYVAELTGRGYTVNPPSVNDGEKIETIGGWVLGETTTDQACVYLYAAHPGLQFRVSTVYEERISELPFAVDVNGKRWMGAAPTREIAENKGVFHEVAEFDIVMTPHEYKKNDKTGFPIMTFGRVHKAQAAPPTASAPAPASNGQHEHEHEEAPWWKAYKHGEMFATWDNRDKAIDWGFAQGVFKARKHADNAYAKLQEELKPGKPGIMWDAWVEDVLQRQADADSDESLLEEAAASNVHSQYAAGAR